MDLLLNELSFRLDGSRLLPGKAAKTSNLQSNQQFDKLHLLLRELAVLRSSEVG